MRSIRDYQYISSSKIDAIFAQIPQKWLEGISAKIGVDIGAFSAEISNASPAEKTHIAKLNALEEFLQSQMYLKSSAVAQTWMRGHFVARAGFLAEQKGWFFLLESKTSKQSFWQALNRILSQELPPRNR